MTEQYVELPGRWYEYLLSLGVSGDVAIEAEKTIIARHNEELSATKEKLELAVKDRDGAIEQFLESQKALREAEKRIRESQEQEPIGWYFGYDEMVDGRIVESGVIVEVGTTPPDGYKGQIWEPLYAMPPIPPELTELQRDKETAMRLVAKTTEENEVLKRSILRVLPTLVEDESCPSSVVEILTQAAHFIKK